ncbi:unnamed protein product [Peniophora sp. CBMAI 1063]|nr:unnamed protein product [Peniophora sp. CBMAI 1063]
MATEDPDASEPFLKSFEEDASGDALWRHYLKVVKGEDEASVESWNGSTEGLLTFNGLFSAAVATFVVDNYRNLEPDTGAQTVALLATHFARPNFTIPASELSSEPFTVPESAVLVNTLWFTSLVISIICSLLATLVQEWARHFRRSIQRGASGMTIKEYSMNHMYQRMGLESYRMDAVASVIVALTHISVVLFLVGLGIFLFPIHQTPARAVTWTAGAGAIFYLWITVWPIIDHKCPFDTPFTTAFSYLIHCVFMISAFPSFMYLGYRWAKSHRWAEHLCSQFSRSLPGIMWIHIYDIFDPDVDFIFFKGCPEGLLEIIPGLSRKFLDDWKHFMDGARMLFLWKRVNGYLLQPENDASVAALLDHLPRQLSEADTTVHDTFFLHLRDHPLLLKPIGRMMTEIKKAGPGAGQGSLKILRMLFNVKHDKAPLGKIISSPLRTVESILDGLPPYIEAIDKLDRAQVYIENRMPLGIFSLCDTLIRLLREQLLEFEDSDLEIGDDEMPRTLKATIDKIRDCRRLHQLCVQFSNITWRLSGLRGGAARDSGFSFRRSKHDSDAEEAKKEKMQAKIMTETYELANGNRLALLMDLVCPQLPGMEYGPHSKPDHVGYEETITNARKQWDIAWGSQDALVAQSRHKPQAHDMLVALHALCIDKLSLPVDIDGKFIAPRSRALSKDEAGMITVIVDLLNGMGKTTRIPSRDSRLYAEKRDRGIALLNVIGGGREGWTRISMDAEGSTPGEAEARNRPQAEDVVELSRGPIAIDFQYASTPAHGNRERRSTPHGRRRVISGGARQQQQHPLPPIPPSSNEPGDDRGSPGTSQSSPQRSSTNMSPDSPYHTAEEGILGLEGVAPSRPHGG